MICRIDKKEILFLIAITVYLSSQFLVDLTVLKTNPFLLVATQYIRYACYLLAVIKIIMDWYHAKSLCRICIVAILVGITILNLRENTFAFYLLMIIAAKDVNFRKIIRQACFVQGIGLATVVFSSQVGLIENFLYIQSGRYRYSLGFTYTTTGPILFFFFMMCYVYLRKEKMRIYEFIVLEVFNYWFYLMTDTRVSFYLSSLMLAYLFFMRYFWQNRKDKIRKNNWLILAPTGCCVGALFIHICYNPEKNIWVTLNTFLNARLRLGWEAMQTYGVTLFGQNIQWVGHTKLASEIEYNYVDCSYMQILLECGIVFLILVVAAYTYMMYVGVKIKDFYLQTVLLFIVVFSITEPRLMNLTFNPFPLLAAAAWSLKKPELLNRKEPIFVPGFKIRTTQIKFKNRI